jgi:hypothetical protein
MPLTDKKVVEGWASLRDVIPPPASMLLTVFLRNIPPTFIDFFIHGVDRGINLGNLFPGFAEKTEKQ